VAAGKPSQQEGLQPRTAAQAFQQVALPAVDVGDAREELVMPSMDLRRLVAVPERETGDEPFGFIRQLPQDSRIPRDSLKILERPSPDRRGDLEFKTLYNPTLVHPAALLRNAQSGVMRLPEWFLFQYCLGDLAGQSRKDPVRMDQMSLDGFLYSRFYGRGDSVIAETFKDMVLKSISVPSYRVSAMTIAKIISFWAADPGRGLALPMARSSGSSSSLFRSG
jgi:hypothetical protein